jgi:hypothetical protein
MVLLGCSLPADGFTIGVSAVPECVQLGHVLLQERVCANSALRCAE